MENKQMIGQSANCIGSQERRTREGSDDTLETKLIVISQLSYLKVKIILTYNKLIFIDMQEKKSNFIDEMRRKLNNYHIQKLQNIQEYQKNNNFYHLENQAKFDLMQFDQSSNFRDEPSGQDITAWNSTRPLNQDYQQRKSFTLKKNVISSVPSKAIFLQTEKRHKNPDMINYLKTILTRLQSPVSGKRCLKTEANKKGQQNSTKVIESAQQIRKSQKNLLKNKNTERVIESKDKKIEKAKFQAIELNTQNNPFTTQSSRANSQYQKIKRKSHNHNQYDIDIARQKDILQQLIRGCSANNKANFSMQKSHKSSQKFSLKNLLC